jgi:hypothetical protein
LTEIKGLYTLIQPTIGLIPEAISTDCDQALWNALLAIFPESPALLCIWHANKNVQQYCKAKFTGTEAYKEFFQAWTSIVQSLDIPEYKS